MKKRISLTVSILFIHVPSTSFAESILDKQYKVSLSISKNGLKSQDACVDLSSTLVELQKMLNDRINRSDILALKLANNILINPIVSFYIALCTHEIFGHGVRTYGVRSRGDRH